MLTPDKLSKLNQNKIVEIYTKLNQQLTRDIIKRLKENENIASVTKAQLKVIARQGGTYIFKQALKRINGISREQKKYINELYNSILETEYRGYKGMYEYTDNKYGISPVANQIAVGMALQTNNEMKNFTNTVAFASQQTYVNAINELYQKVMSGSFDYVSAIKSTVNDLAKKGVTISSEGRSYKLESAVKMNLFTSITQTTNKIAEQIKNEIGADGVWLAPTPYCRPSHKVINGKTMSLKEFKKYEHLLSEPYCYHLANYIVMDAFEEPYTKSELRKINKNADKKYQIRQKQNYYARQVRNAKENISNLKTVGEMDLLDKAKKELRNAQLKYRTFCKQNGLDVDYLLTWKAGYNK